IIARLADGPARISDVAAPFPMSLTGFSELAEFVRAALGPKISTALPPIAVDINNLLAEDSVTIEIGNH
ncbi:MAG TPA: hypothetical protein VF772_15205, partial [Terriglobales bacterium]